MHILKTYGWARNLNLVSKIVFVVVCAFSHCIYANTDFSQGVAALEAKDWPKAEALFQRVLSVNPNAVEAYYNLGLLKLRQNQYGWSLGYLYKALDIHPGYAPAKVALSEVKEKISVENFAGFWGSLRSKLLTQVSYDFLWIIFLVVISLTCFFWIQFFKKRQKAFVNETALPQMRGVHFFFSIVTVFVFFMLALQTFDRRHSKAVSVLNEIQVFSAPFEESTQTPQFVLPEGSLLEVLREQNEFYQVRSVRFGSGWVRKGQVFIFSNEIF